MLSYGHVSIYSGVHLLCLWCPIPLSQLLKMEMQRKNALSYPLSLAACGLVTSAYLLLFCAFIQGVVSTAYWVTNLPLLTESTTERQRVGVFALNSFLLLGIGSLGSLLGGAIPEFIASTLHISAASTIALRWGVFAAALFTFVFGLPLWFLRESKRTAADTATDKATQAVLEE